MQNSITDNWEKVKLGIKVDITSSKRIFAHEYKDSGIPFYRGKEIIEKSLGQSISTDLFISLEKYQEVKNKYGVPKEGDLLLTSVGTIGIPYLVKANENFYFKDGNLTWFRNFSGVNNKFIYYWIQSALGKEQLAKHTIGSSQQALTIDGLKKMDIILPPLEIQNKIAAILETLDGKIEVNNKIAKALEEMAQAVFKEWFVNFRFPGYEKVKFVDSELGMIPEGWEFKKLYEYARLEYGKSLKENNRKIGKIPVYGSSGQVGLHNEKLVAGPGIVIGRKGNVGSVYWIDTDFYPIDTTFFISTNNSIYFIFFILKNMRFHTGDSAVPGLNRDSVHNQDILIPDISIINNFESQIKPVFKKVEKIYKENQKLASLRDLLLPKLMKGEIRV